MGRMLTPFLASLLKEVTVVGIVNFVFLALFIVAGVRQAYKLKE